MKTKKMRAQDVCDLLREKSLLSDRGLRLALNGDAVPLDIGVITAIVNAALEQQADAAPVDKDGNHADDLRSWLDELQTKYDGQNNAFMACSHKLQQAEAALAQRVVSEAVPVEKPFHHYGLSAEQVQQLLEGSLKSEEISGAEDVQHSRVHELVWWFARLTQGNANPKWAVRHACELAYFVATNGINRSIDLESVRSAAFKEGVNITLAERATLERIGFATPPAAPVALSDAKPEILDDLGNTWRHGLREEDSKCDEHPHSRNIVTISGVGADQILVKNTSTECHYIRGHNDTVLKPVFPVISAAGKEQQ